MNTVSIVSILQREREREDNVPIKEAFSFKTVTMSPHHHHCNCKCVYCGLWQVKDKVEPYSMIEPVKSLFEQGVIDKKAIFCWGGGESSILKGFEETSRWISEKGYFQAVNTNALKYSSAMGRFLNIGMGSVNISLDSPNAEVYRKVKGVAGFEAVVTNIKKYLSDSCIPQKQVFIKYIIFEQNNSLQNIKDFFKLMVRLGVRHVEFSFDFHEVQKNAVSTQSIEAAVYFLFWAQMYKMECVPFFVHPDLMEKIHCRTNELFK